MHYLAQKVKQGKASMGQSLHLVKVMAQKGKHTFVNKVLVFLFMLLDYFYTCANQVHDCAFFCFCS